MALADPDRGRRRRRHPARRAVDRRRRHLLARGPPGRGRPARPRPGRRRRLDRRPDPGAVQRPHRGSTSTAAGRTSWSAASSSSRTSPTGGSTGSIRAPRRPCRSPRTARGATPTCGPTPPGAASSPSARTTAATAEPANTIVADPARRRRPAGRSSRAPTSSPRRGCRRTATRLAWLEWDHPDMPWDATLLRVAAFEPDGTLGEAILAAGGPDESIVQPDGRPTARSTSSATGAGWWNLYRLVDGPRLEPLAAMEAEFADPAWIFGRSSLRVPARRRDRGRRPLAAAATTSTGSSRARCVGEVEIAVHRARAACSVGAARGRRRGRPRRRPVGRRPLRSGDAGPGRRPAPGEHRHVRPGDHRRARSRSSSRRPAAGPPTRSTTRRRNPDFRGPDGERPPLVVLSHGGPTSNASTALDLGKQFLTSRGIAVVDVDYGGSTGLRPRVPPAPRRAVGHRRRRRLRRGGAVPRRARRRRPGPAGHRGRQRRRLHDARGARVPRRLRGRDQPLRDRRPGAARHATRHKFESRYNSTAWSARTRRPPRSTASARRATSPTGSRARS